MIDGDDSVKVRSGPGRPMSDALHRAVLDATNRLLRENAVGDLTINGIAKEAGVSRPAIYRRWTNPREIALDAFLETTAAQIPVKEHATAKEMLHEQILAMARFMRGRGGRIIAELLGEGQRDAGMLAMFRERFLAARRGAARMVIEKGIETGEFDAAIDIEMAIDLYAGPIYYRLIVGHGGITDAFAEELTKRVYMALRPAH